MSKLTEAKAWEILDAYCKAVNDAIDEMKKDPCRYMIFKMWIIYNYPDYKEYAKVLHENYCRNYRTVKKPQ